MRYICKLENLRNHPNRMEALHALLDLGLPLTELTYTGVIPDDLRIGRRARGAKFSDHWVVETQLISKLTFGELLATAIRDMSPSDDIMEIERPVLSLSLEDIILGVDLTTLSEDKFILVEDQGEFAPTLESIALD